MAHLHLAAAARFSLCPRHGNLSEIVFVSQNYVETVQKDACLDNGVPIS